MRSSLIDVIVTNNRVVDSSQTFLENITRYVDGSFTFSSGIMGGYLTAQVELTLSDEKAWTMLSTYLGSRIAFLHPLAQNPNLICWEGLIYTVTIDDGKTSTSRSLANLYNQVRVTYSPLSFDASGKPVYGQQTVTSDVNYTPTQTSWGIRELNYTIGGASSTDASNLASTLLGEYQRVLALSANAKRGNGGSPSDVRVTLDCAGYWETLDKRFYKQTATTTAANLDAIVKAVLTGVGQFVNSDQSNITANTQQRTQFSAGNVTAQNFINSLCSYGGPNNRRFYLGFYELGKPYYSEEPTVVGYHARRLDPAETIYDASSGLPVEPWLVQPGKIIQFDDILPDSVSYTTALNNSRSFLIGQTTFTAPNVVELTPLVKDPSQLRLARMGLI